MLIYAARFRRAYLLVTEKGEFTGRERRVSRNGPARDRQAEGMDWREKFRNWWNSTSVEIGPAEDPDESVDPYDPFPEPVRVPLSDVFDLHTVRPDQTKLVVAIYLDDARAAGYRSVRLIHGKGVGVQRATVRSVLAATPFVETFTDAPPEAGGWGATIAFFK